jgi:hypothetical protein
VTLPFPRTAPGPAFRFAVTGADHDPHALGPTLRLSLTVTETTGTRIHALALRSQIRIEPVRRRYSPVEQNRLVELFGDPERWGRTLNPMQLATVGSVTTSFTGEHELALEVPLTYDTEVAATRYFRGLADGGDVPLLLLFSGTVFYESPGTGVQVGLVPWSSEAAFRLPIAVWRQMMAAHHGGTAWLQLPEDTLARLSAWRAARALPSWEQTFDALLDEAGGPSS